MKVKVKLTEMHSAEATHVSLVKNGANGIGARIMKSNKEQAMLNLSKIGNVFKAAPTEEVKKAAPAVVGLIVMKGSDAQHQAVLKALAAAGAKTDAVKDIEGGAVLVAQAEFDPKEVETVQISETTLAVIKSFSPYNMTEGDFDKKLKTEGVYQSLYTACSAFQSSVYDVLAKAESPADAKRGASDICKQFSSYVTDLLGALPSEAFKWDKAVADAVKEVEKAEATAKEAAAKAEPAKTEAPAAEAPKTEPVVKAEQPDFAKVIADALAPVAKTIADLTTAVADLAKKQDEQGKAVETAVAKAADLEKKLSTTVVAAVKSADTPADTGTKKAEDDEDNVPIMDTAFSRTRKTHTRLYGG